MKHGCKFSLYFLKILTVILLPFPVFSQNLIPESGSGAPPDSLFQAKRDSLKVASDIKSRIKYLARDSIRFDVKKQIIYLYGNAEVHYENISLKAAAITLDWNTSVLSAEGMTDSSGKNAGRPVFFENDQEYTADLMKYNFKTQKGKISYGRTKSDDGFIAGNEVKKLRDNTYYIHRGNFTTCDAIPPHFHISAGRLKVVPKKIIVTGPLNLNIFRVPLPVVLPLGVFPNKSGRRSGILPPAYGESVERGFFLRDGGYYWAINDYLGIEMRGDIYTKGGWGLRENLTYNRRYSFQGTLGADYAILPSGEKEEPGYSRSRMLFVRWNHNQSFGTSSRFSANVNAGSSSYLKNFSYDTEDYLTNTLQSSVAFSRSWRRGYNATVNLYHDQNTQDSVVNLRIPEISLSHTRIFPLRRKIQIGARRWYENIGYSYSFQLSNRVSQKEHLLFKPETVSLFRNGAQLSVPVSVSLKVLKYLSLTPSFNYLERYYPNIINKTYDPVAMEVETDTLDKIRAARTFNTGLSFSTRLYGIFPVSGKHIKGIRHVMSPALSFSYYPDFSNEFWNYYKSVQTDSSGNNQTYSVFQNGLFGSPTRGKSGTLGFSMGNTLEMKTSRKKTGEEPQDRTINLIEGLSFSTGYNFAADSLNLSPLAVSGRTNLSGKISLNTSASFDPYAITESGIRYNKLVFEASRKIARLTAATVSMGTSLHSPVKKSSQKDTLVTGKNLLLKESAFFSMPWDLSVNYSLNLFRPVPDTNIYTQSLTFSGSVRLTEKWKMGFSSGFDFKAKDITYTSVNIYRDLHCWELRFNWIPFGIRKSYNVTLNVKSATLRDLKIEKKDDWYDRFR